MRPALAALSLSVVFGASMAAADSPDFRADDDVSAAGLSASCASRHEESIYACRLAIASTIDIHRLIVANHPELAAYCPKQEPTIEEARLTFLRWMERKEARLVSLHISGGVGVLMALRDSWPCMR
jgi:Rap1a immunity proteins